MKKMKPPARGGQQNVATIRVDTPRQEGGNGEEPPESPEVEALEEAIGTLPTGSIAKLYRLEEDGTKAFVAQTAPEAMTEERIAKAGPGSYRVFFFGPQGDGSNKKVYKGSRTVKIAAGLSGVVSNADGTPVLDPMAAMMQAQMLGMMESMGKQRQIELSLMERLVNRPEAKSVEWGPILTVVAPLLTTLLTTLLNRKDPIELAAEIQKLQAPIAAAKDPLEQLKGMIAVVKDLTREGGDDDSDRGGSDRKWWEGPVERIATALLSHQQSSGGGAAPGAEVEVPPATLAAAAATQPALNAGGSVSLESIVASHGPTLVQWAHQGRDPGWAAETLLYEVPEFYHSVIAKRIQEEPGLVNAIIAAYPEFGPVREWVEALRDALLETILGTDEEEDPPDVGARTVNRTPKKKGPNDAAT